MSERFYPPTEEELRKRRILTPQPSRAPFSPSVDYFEASPAPPPAIAKPPGCVFIKPCQLPDGITHYFNPAGYVPLELIKEYSHLSLLGGREVDSRGTVAWVGAIGIAFGGFGVRGHCRRVRCWWIVDRFGGAGLAIGIGR